MTVTYLPAEAEPPATRVAFAISRKVGNAVTRNRLRRRLRAVMRDLDGAPGGLRPGTYLLTATPELAGVPYEQLTEFVAAACSRSSSPPGGSGR